MAADVVSSLGVPTFGLGGDELAHAGADIVAHLREFTTMGVGSVATRTPSLAWAAARLATALSARRPRAALLVGFSEFNARLGPLLRARGLPVLWYGAPQIWAWRERRGRRLRRAADRLAVILPFEEPLWRQLGADARYVGHPALDETRLGRVHARAKLSIAKTATSVAVLPGSRPAEVRRHLEPMLDAIRQLQQSDRELEARVLLAPSLDRNTLAWAQRSAEASGVRLAESPMATTSLLPAFDIALASSGTATLQCALAQVPPVVVYRAPPLLGLLARALVHLEHIALPNIVLGRRAFPELVQRDATATKIASAARHNLRQRRELRAACLEVDHALRHPRHGTENAPSRVAGMMKPWFA